MDFWLLPPEINSLRLWTGPGSTPLLAAATVWDGLSQQLYATASEVTAVIGAIPWTGPSAQAMRAAMTRYTGWLTATAAQAEVTAQQARTAAAAYETARATAVNPAVVIANRQLLALLIATNLLGQNTSAIAATEAQYMQMWAQDVAAMSVYQASSSGASQLPPFQPPTDKTTSVVKQDDTNPTPGGVLSNLSNLGNILSDNSVIGQYLQALVSSGSLFDAPLGLLALFSALWALDTPNSPLLNSINSVAQAEAHATTAPMPAPTAIASVRATMGTATRTAGLSTPRVDWAQPPASAPTRAPTVRPIPRQEQHDVAIPLPMPLPLAARGTPTKQPRPEPDYGQYTTKFVPRNPAGG